MINTQIQIQILILTNIMFWNQNEKQYNMRYDKNMQWIDVTRIFKVQNHKDNWNNHTYNDKSSNEFDFGKNYPWIFISGCWCFFLDGVKFEMKN